MQIQQQVRCDDTQHCPVEIHTWIAIVHHITGIKLQDELMKEPQQCARVGLALVD